MVTQHMGKPFTSWLRHKRERNTVWWYRPEIPTTWESETGGRFEKFNETLHKHCKHRLTGAGMHVLGVPKKGPISDKNRGGAQGTLPLTEGYLLLIDSGGDGIKTFSCVHTGDTICIHQDPVDGSNAMASLMALVKLSGSQN